MTLPYEFKECLFSTPDHRQDEKFLVIYRAAEGKKDNFEDLATGYLDAASIIIEHIYKGKTDTEHDKFALPLLNLYCNAIEFSLKHLISHLIAHRALKTCNSISVPPNDYQKIFYTHDLEGLAGTVRKMVPDVGILHTFNDFTQIESFIKHLSSYEINAASTRYLLKKDETNKLHSKQSWINFEKLHKSIDFLCKNVINYSEEDEFCFCEAKEFSRRRLNELIESYKMMIFVRHEVNQYLTSDTPSIRSKLWNKIRHLPSRQLAVLSMGLSFIRQPVTIPNLENFLLDTVEENQENVLKKAHLYKRARKGLKNHIQYVKRFIQK